MASMGFFNPRERLNNYARRVVEETMSRVAYDSLLSVTFTPWVIGVCLLVAGTLSPCWHIYGDLQCSTGLWGWYRNDDLCLEKWNSRGADLIIWVQIFILLGSALSAVSVVSTMIAASTSDLDVRRFCQTVALGCSVFDGALILSGCIVFWVQFEEKRQVGASYWLTMIGGLLHIPRGLIATFIFVSTMRVGIEVEHED